MDKKTSKEYIKYLLATGIPVHPNTARSLYEDAGLPLPKHLQKEVSDERGQGAQKHI